MPSSTLTRRELYELVWQTPMTKLAETYGLSGRGLAKLCERHAIPVPGRGHWALTRAGYVMERDPLPPTPSPETQVQITGHAPPHQDEHPLVATQIDYESCHPIIVSDRLDRPHRLVAQAKSALRPRVPGVEGVFATRGNPLPIRVSAKQIPRALRIFDALFKAIEERGFQVNTIGHGRESRTTISVHGEELAISLEESNRRSEHVLTAREETERRKGHGWGIPRYDYAPSGIFAFSIDEYAEGLQHRWSDRAKRPLDACLNDIVIALVRISVTILRPRRIEAELRRQREAEEERQRRIYWARMEALNRSLKEWQEAQQLRTFISAVEQAAQKRWDAPPAKTPIEGWLRWVHAVAERLDPLPNYLSHLA